jgi:cation diffusion facilitator CzcD-associated flavoprotein CzcO
VLIIGGGFSGLDIASEVSKVTASVYLSLNQNAKENMIDQLSTIIEKYGKALDWSKIAKKGLLARIETSTADSCANAIFQDGSTVPIDVVLFCTGYFYSYPFLDDDVIEETRSKHVRPIYKQLLHPRFPSGSLSFIALPK